MKAKKPDLSSQEFGEDLENEQKQKEAQHRELEDAIQKFLSKGRSIKVLPPQEIKSKTVVGGDRWDVPEVLTEIQRNPLD